VFSDILLTRFFPNSIFTRFYFARERGLSPGRRQKKRSTRFNPFNSLCRVPRVFQHTQIGLSIIGLSLRSPVLKPQKPRIPQPINYKNLRTRLKYACVPAHTHARKKKYQKNFGSDSKNVSAHLITPPSGFLREIESVIERRCTVRTSDYSSKVNSNRN
jgi:hypothetical protein